MVHLKEPLLVIGKSSLCSGVSVLYGPLPYVQCHIIVNKNVLNVSLNKTFPSFHYIISLSGQCSTTGVTEAVVCTIMSVGCCIYGKSYS